MRKATDGVQEGLPEHAGSAIELPDSLEPQVRRTLEFTQRHCPIIPFAPLARKFSISLKPCSVRKLSGWNWTPDSRALLCWIAITTPSFEVALTSNSGLSRATASEW